MSLQVQVNSGDFINLWTRSGIAPGTAIVLNTNGGPDKLLYSTNASPSAANEINVPNGTAVSIPAGTTNLFVRGSGSLLVQTAAEYAEYQEDQKASVPLTVKVNADGTPSSVRPDYAAAVVGAASSGGWRSAFITTTGSIQNVHLRAEVDNPLGTNYTELRIQSDGEMRWSGGNNGKMIVDSGGKIRFSVAAGTYQSALFGPRVGDDGNCSVLFQYTSTVGDYHKMDSNADGLSIWDSSNVLGTFRRSSGNLELRGIYRGVGAFICTFETSIDANANREPGVWGSYASSATNAPDIAGILWNGMSGNNATNGYIGVADGGQLWQNYSNGGFYTRKRWGGGFGAWTYIGG